MKGLLDLILPPRCFGCGVLTAEHHVLCPLCWKNCSFLCPPWCILCGLPFPYETPGQALCLSCYRLPPVFTQCRSALSYHQGSCGFILKFKQGDGTNLAPGLGRFMMGAGKDILSKTDLLVPVPLHWSRLFWRQYNQATLLSKQITAQTSIPTYVELIKRDRHTQKQGHQSRRERYANVRGAFVVPSHKAHFLKGKRVTLIDDVFTTGATLNECTKALLKGGAKEVRALTLARVIIPS